MALSLHRNRLRSPAFADWADYDVMEEGMVVGRIYEDRYTSASCRWFWSITAFHVDPAFEITTNARVPTMEQARTQFREAWRKVCETTKQKKAAGPTH